MTFSLSRLVFTSLTMGAIALFAGIQSAQAQKHGMHASKEAQEKIVIEDAYIFPVGRYAPAAALFMTLHNNAGHADKLVSAEFVNPNLADRLELHTHVKEAGIMRMRKVESFDIPASGHHTLSPHGDHIMIMAPKQAYDAGMEFELTLHFEKAGPRTITVPVIPRGEPLNKKHNHQENHGGHAH